MSLSFNKIQKINFGGLEVLPKMNTELKMRLQEVDAKTEAGLGEMKQVLSECFGDKASEVRQFMDENMSVIDLYELQAYLLGGDKGVELYHSNLDKAMEKSMEGVING